MPRLARIASKHSSTLPASAPSRTVYGRGCRRPTRSRASTPVTGGPRTARRRRPRPTPAPHGEVVVGRHHQHTRLDEQGLHGQPVLQEDRRPDERRRPCCRWRARRTGPRNRATASPPDPGKRVWNAARIFGVSSAAALAWKPTIRLPPPPLWAACRVAAASRSALVSSAGPRRGGRALPRSLTWRLVRSSSRAPSWCSSLRICTLSDGWLMCNLAAARPKCSSSPPPRSSAAIAAPAGRPRLHSMAAAPQTNAATYRSVVRRYWTGR
jgi:hypothetical protein